MQGFDRDHILEATSRVVQIVPWCELTDIMAEDGSDAGLRERLSRIFWGWKIRRPVWRERRILSASAWLEPTRYVHPSRYLFAASKSVPQDMSPLEE